MQVNRNLYQVYRLLHAHDFFVFFSWIINDFKIKFGLRLTLKQSSYFLTECKDNHPIADTGQVIVTIISMWLRTARRRAVDVENLSGKTSSHICMYDWR